MAHAKDRTGIRYGRLVAVSLTDKRATNGSAYWLCRCDCGKEKEIDGASLDRGDSQSCGCFHKEQATKANLRRLGKANADRFFARREEANEYDEDTI